MRCLLSCAVGCVACDRRNTLGFMRWECPVANSRSVIEAWSFCCVQQVRSCLAYVLAFSILDYILSDARVRSTSEQRVLLCESKLLITPPCNGQLIFDTFAVHYGYDISIALLILLLLVVLLWVYVVIRGCIHYIMHFTKALLVKLYSYR